MHGELTSDQQEAAPHWNSTMDYRLAISLPSMRKVWQDSCPAVKTPSEMPAFEMHKERRREVCHCILGGVIYMLLHLLLALLTF